MSPRPGAILLLACCGFAQTAKNEFEVATVKPSQPPTIRVGCRGGPGMGDPSLLQCEQMSLLNLILYAYNRNSYQVVAPEWLRGQIFDVSAKIPAGATREQLPEMMRRLLIERFHLEAHVAPHDVLTYTLAVAKGGIKCKPTASDAPALPPAPYSADLDKDGYPTLAPGHSGIAMLKGRGRLYFSGWTMQQFAKQASSLMHSPVTDATGLTGKYDIGVYWLQMPIPDADGPTFPQAIEEQLGLRLVAVKGSIDAVYVDRIDKLPTAN